MRKLWTIFVSTIHARIGWNRIGFAASLAVLGIAGYTLYRMLHKIDPALVVRAMADMPISVIATAALFIFAAYCTLTFYDFFALRTIGVKHVPYRVAALGAFASYAIGHNLGATVFTGGAIRFRIYSAWGLTLLDVAKIAFVSGLTFWLGNSFVLGLGMALAPDAASAIDHLPSWINQLIGVGGLVVICGYLIWLMGGRREIGVKSVSVVLPNAQLTFVQILIGVADLGLAAIGMYLLLPTAPAIDFQHFVVVFVLATLLGFLSHTPGGLGVFDAAILIALPQFPKEQLLATLLIFRVIYYMVPFALALSIMCGREILIASQRPRPAPVEASTTDPLPQGKQSLPRG